MLKEVIKDGFRKLGVKYLAYSDEYDIYETYAKKPKLIIQRLVEYIDNKFSDRIVELEYDSSSIKTQGRAEIFLEDRSAPSGYVSAVIYFGLVGISTQSSAHSVFYVNE